SSIAVASRLLARFLSSLSSVAVAASFGGGVARNSRPEAITQVFQEPAFAAIGSPATCWANDLGISSNTQSPLRRTVATEMRFIASSLVWRARLAAIACWILHQLSGPKRPVHEPLHIVPRREVGAQRPWQLIRSPR